MTSGDRILFYAEDVAAECKIAQATARRWMAAGRFGRTLPIGTRKAVLVEDFLRGLRALRDGKPLGRRSNPTPEAVDIGRLENGRYARRGGP